MVMRRIAFLFLMSVLLSNCHQLYKVSSTEDGDVDGIPFLSKKAVVEQKTTFMQPFYDVSASLTMHTIFESDTTTQVYSFPDVRVSYRSDILHQLRELTIRSETWNAADVNEFITLYKKMSDSSFMADEAIPVGNIQQRKIVIDNTRTYFLNGRASWFGSSELDFELNEDNTLTKSSTSQATDISGLLTEWIPASSIISKALNLTEEGKEEAEEKLELRPDTVSTFEVELEMAGGAYQYDFFREFDTYERDRSAIDFDLENGNYTRTILPAAAKKEQSKTEEESDDSSMKIEGRVTWPPTSEGN